MRAGLLVGALLLAAAGLVSCGGDDPGGDGPGADGAGGDGSDGSGDGATVSVAKFCDAAETFESTFKETDTADLPTGLPALKAAARELEGLGTPGELPDDARKGLVLTLDKLIALPDDTTESELIETLRLTGDEKAESTAFENYLDDHCDYRAKGGS
jgi:hypothetical protein